MGSEVNGNPRQSREKTFATELATDEATSGVWVCEV